MTEIVGFDHVQLAMPVGEEARAVEFFEGLLGLRQVPKSEPLASRGGCWFEGPGVKVHLGVEADFRPARKAHPALLVRGLDELVDQLQAAGLEVRTGDVVGGRPQRFVDDPFGNRIELVAAD
jgi:catechol 2,3-dioxygenase-like lactoylglutathione lyase family enzyme